jgi:hypothetical protein
MLEVREQPHVRTREVRAPAIAGVVYLPPQISPHDLTFRFCVRPCKRECDRIPAFMCCASPSQQVTCTQTLQKSRELQIELVLKVFCHRFRQLLSPRASGLRERENQQVAVV